MGTAEERLQKSCKRCFPLIRTKWKVTQLWSFSQLPTWQLNTTVIHLEGWWNMIKCVTDWRILGQGWLNTFGNYP
jgi:hypothetical protein